jgi:hypothetical protein
MEPEENIEEINENDDRSYTESEKLSHKKMWETSNTEQLIKGWGEKAGGLRWMHLKSAEYWHTKDEWLSMSNVLMSSMTSASSFLASVQNETIPTSYVMVFVGIVGLLNVLTLSISQYYSSSQNATLHETASKQFGHFNRFVATKLSLSRMERGDPREVMRYALKENERLYNETIDPHPTSVALYKTFICKQDTDEDICVSFNTKFSVPDILNTSFVISVYKERDMRNNPVFNLNKQSLDIQRPHN